MTYNIVFLDRATVAPEIQFRSPNFPHTWKNHDTTDAEYTAERLSNADICITNKVSITRDTLEKCPHLKLVAIAATGVDAVDISACKERGVKVFNIRGYATVSVPEHTLSMILSLRRNLFQYRQELIQGRWQKENQFCYFNEPLHDLAGSTLGLIGTGAIAQATGKLGEAFGMKVIYASLSGRSEFDSGTLVDIDTLFAESDIVSLHCPFTEQSKNLVNAQRLSQMKNTALLINTARGGVVDIAALKEALDNKLIAGAALDVLPDEPPTLDSPEMAMAHYHNVVITPHVAWASQQAMQDLAEQLIDNMEAFIDGKPKNLVLP